MLQIILHFFLNFFNSKIQLQLENIYFLKQLEILIRNNKKSEILTGDRFFFLTMKNIFLRWKENLVIIKPETVIKWHRIGFKLYWKWKSRNDGGRSKIPQEQINLIKQIANKNPQWGIPRIHGEILKLRFDISGSTVLRYISKKNGRTSDLLWKTFLKNHTSEIIAIDFFSVPTLNFMLLHVRVFLSHGERKIIHLNIMLIQNLNGQLNNLRMLYMNPKFLST
jgi:putative transposase